MSISKINTVEFHEVSSDPSGGGLAAPIGSLAHNTSTGDMYQKTGGGNTDWTQTASGTLADGTYTPTITNNINIASTSNIAAQYLRVGDTVHVFMRMEIDTTTGDSISVLEISLPIASNFTSTDDLMGIGNTYTGTEMRNSLLSADTSDDRAVMSFTSDSGATDLSWYITFTYQVL